MADQHSPHRDSGLGILTLLWMREFVGFIPFIGLALHGTWDQGELGFGTLMLIFGTRELTREHRARRASLRAREPHDRS